MADKKSFKLEADPGSEDAYFREQDMLKLKELREKATEDKTEQYLDDHKSHCFRCGTKSLVEIDHGEVKVDICVNEGCGAIHLDPGELEQLEKKEGVMSSISKSVLSVFK